MNKIAVVGQVVVAFAKRHPSKLTFVLLALCVIPYFAYQNMQSRRQTELVSTLPLDDQVTGVKLLLGGATAVVSYQDGSRLDADGIGIAAITWADHQKAEDRLKPANLKEGDFPVVVFFNTSGFDATGDPQVVRRAKDGTLLWRVEGAPRRLRVLTPLRSGAFRGYSGVPGAAVEISEETFYKSYVGVEPPLKLPPAEELNKMTDEQLRKLGLSRAPEALLEKKTPAAPPEAKKQESSGPVEIQVAKPMVKQAKSGIRGSVYRVGGALAVTPLSVPLYVLKGRSSPQETLDPKDSRLVATLVTDKDGAFAVPLPAGEYTLVVEIDGKPRGNAINVKFWPSVQVTATAWTEYEFRVGR